MCWCFSLSLSSVPFLFFVLVGFVTRVFILFILSLFPVHGNLSLLFFILSLSLSSSLVLHWSLSSTWAAVLKIFFLTIFSMHETGIYYRQLKELVIESNGWTIHLTCCFFFHFTCGTRCLLGSKVAATATATSDFTVCILLQLVILATALCVICFTAHEYLLIFCLYVICNWWADWCVSCGRKNDIKG